MEGTWRVTYKIRIREYRNKESLTLTGCFFNGYFADSSGLVSASFMTGGYGVPLFAHLPFSWCRVTSCVTGSWIKNHLFCRVMSYWSKNERPLQQARRAKAPKYDLIKGLKCWSRMNTNAQEVQMWHTLLAMHRWYAYLYSPQQSRSRDFHTESWEDECMTK